MEKLERRMKIAIHREEESHARAGAFSAVRSGSRGEDTSVGRRRRPETDRLTKRTRRNRLAASRSQLGEKEAEAMSPEGSIQKARREASNQQVEHNAGYVHRDSRVALAVAASPRHGLHVRLPNQFLPISRRLHQAFTRPWDTNRTMNSKSLLPVLFVPSFILLIPLAAMLFKVDGWAWDAAAFIAAWVLMAGVGVAYKLVTRKAGSRAYRVATGVALAAGLILIWINGAVGLIGSEDHPANLMYGGVLAVGVIGAVIARLEPLGMARALFATALAQFVVPVVALIIWRADFSPGSRRCLG